MMTSSHRLVRRALGLAFLTAVAPSAGAQVGTGLPPAKEIIERYVKAIGGDSWKSHKSARMKAKMEMQGQAMTMEVMHVFPNVMLQKVEMAGMGEIKTGFDGSIAWSTNSMQGPRILTGPEAEGLRDDADPMYALRMSPNIASTETVEKTSMNGKECYKVKLVSKSGRESFDCYSVSDGLLVAVTSKQVSPMGEVEVTQFQNDYKDFGGVKRPTSISQQMMGMSITVTLTSWEWDTVDPKEVALPPEIKAMAEKKP